MKENEYLSIKEFAEKARVSTQAVYQRAEKDLKVFVKVKNNRKFISIAALPFFEDKQINQVVNCKGEELKDTDISATVLNIFVNQLAIKDKQLENKDKQMAEKDKQISELTTALINEQHSAQQAHALHAGTMQQKSIEESTNKKGLFLRWFKK
jgi:predicted DNA-binding protein YlxM (UPF0122 family)